MTVLSLFLLLACPSQPEEKVLEEGTRPFDCTDAEDNDNDGLIDCNDPSCQGRRACDTGDLQDTEETGDDPDLDCLPDQKDPDHAVVETDTQTIWDLGCCCYGPCSKFNVKDGKLVTSGGQP